MKLKGISLYEPYASLMATGAKRFETRSWKTAYRGPVLICAAQWCIQSEILYRLQLPIYQGGLAPLVGKPLDFSGKASYGLGLKDLQFGKALLLARLVNCIPTITMTREQVGTDWPYGDFTPGRYAWDLVVIKRFAKPFRYRGRQGLFDAEIPDPIFKS